ncbi:MAG: asparagine synthase-related protein [Ktedonobacteraceae bacterium]
MPILTGSIARPLPKSPDSKARRRWLPKWEMKTVDGIEKGILRRAFARVLPVDVRDRRKSAYPTVQNPAYDRATREWTLELLDDANAPVQPLLNTRVVRELAESDAPLPPNMVVSPFERIIQMNEWLKKYEVTLSL